MRCFPIARLNALLYRWLAAWFATAPVATIEEIDPLRRDLVTLRRARETVAKVQALFPGLVRPYQLLAAATAQARPRRPLPRIEQEVERIVLALLGARRAARRPAMVGRDRRGRPAGEGAARISADAALPAVGRLLDARGRCRRN